MSALDEHLKKHRKQIIDREEKTFREMLAAYTDVEKELKKSFDALQQQIEAAIANGETISPSWFYREQRLKKLLAQVEAQISRFGGTATKIVEREQRAAINIAIRQAQETFDLEISGSDVAPRDLGSTLNPRTVETAVGMMGDGSPILSYFEQQLAPAVAEKIKSEVIKAAAIGTDFKTISKRLQETGGITKHRALSVARTEVNRVRRETSRQVYEENDDIISGWEWVASKSSRTCPLCLAMDGRTFPLDEPFPQHINCRCTMIAVIIGLPRRPRTLGKDWFETKDDATKESILGKEAFLAHQQNGLTLDDFVAFRNDKRFGKSVTRKPLAKILADKNLNETAQGNTIQGVKEFPKKAKGEGYFFRENTLPYSPKGAVIAQIQPEACVAAATRMILKDAGISRSEAELRSLFETDRDGTSPSKIPEIMKGFGLKYDYRRDLRLEDLQTAVKIKPAIVYVSKSLPNMPGHVIIIDGFEDDYALVRDSQNGVGYKLHIEDFKLAWMNENRQGKAAIAGK